MHLLNHVTAVVATLDSLKSLPKEEAILLVKQAEDMGSYDLIWELLNIYEADSLPQSDIIPAQNKYNVSLQELYDLANSITPNNPHYKEAQEKCVHILMQFDPPKEEYDAALQLKFKHAVASNNQELSDLLFRELCGMSMEPASFSGIKPDSATLCTLAQAIKELKQENLQLQRTIQTNASSQFQKVKSDFQQITENDSEKDTSSTSKKGFT